MRGDMPGRYGRQPPGVDPLGLGDRLSPECDPLVNGPNLAESARVELARPEGHASLAVRCLAARPALPNYLQSYLISPARWCSTSVGQFRPF